jgi:hypothetical protein
METLRSIFRPVPVSRVLSDIGVTSCAPTGGDAMTIDATNVNESADFTVDSFLAL